MTRPATVGFTERLAERYVGAGVRGFGPVPEMIVTAGYSVAASLLLTRDARGLAAVVVLFGAFRGAILRAMTARTTAKPWQRAAGLVVSICAEGAVIAAAAVWARRHEALPGPLAIGFLAFGGALLLSYARTRIRASSGDDLPDGPYGIASREVRLLVLAAGILAGQAYWALVVIAVLANAAVLGHLVRLRATLRD